jgi:hypothetical protein
MKKVLPWVLGLAVGVALGIGATLLVQTATAEESEDCETANRWVHHEVALLETQSTSYPALTAQKEALDWIDTLLDVRWKLCNP